MILPQLQRNFRYFLIYTNLDHGRSAIALQVAVPSLQRSDWNGPCADKQERRSSTCLSNSLYYQWASFLVLAPHLGIIISGFCFSVESLIYCGVCLQNCSHENMEETIFPRNSIFIATLWWPQHNKHWNNSGTSMIRSYEICLDFLLLRYSTCKPVLNLYLPGGLRKLNKTIQGALGNLLCPWEDRSLRRAGYTPFGKCLASPNKHFFICKMCMGAGISTFLIEMT
jgi:hypothetical protein